DVSLILPNSPRVNTNQEFTLSFDIINTSQIAVSDVIVGLVSTGASLFDREIIVGTMEPLEVRAISVPVVAAGTVNASETMTFTARSGAGGVTQSTRFATFTIQTPASIRLEAAVAPVSGSIAQIGRELSLEFRLVNEGEAEIELSQLVVSAQGARLNVSQTVDLTLEKRSLILGAPQTEASLLIRAILTKTPIDRNTGLPALITSPGADKFEQTLAVVASLARASASITLSKPAGILLGELRDLARLTLTNESSDQFATLEIESMRIFFRDPSGERLDPRDILALNQSLLVDDNGQVVSGRLAVDSALQVFFAPNSLSAGSTSAYNFVTRIDSAARIGAFVVSIPLDDIEIRVTGGLQSGQVFSPEAPSGAPSIFETTYILGAPAFAESFTPMNNPFNPSAGPNLYRYTLAADAGVELSVYTLTGDLVRRYSFASGAPGGTVGVQTVSWDGRNGDGLLVRNGVYLLQLVNLFTGEKVTLQQATLR
ncbi:MAG: hypothetical protein ACE5GA_08550, partial [Candidatus Zixiibacteriota bacterium]